MTATFSLLEHKLAIEELIGRYNHSLDSYDLTTWLDCWTDDAVFDGIGKYLVGKAAIKSFADTYERDFGAHMPSGKHYTVNILSQINGDQATSRSYLQLVRTTAKGVQIVFTGRYEDTLRREGETWRFAGRKMIQDFPPKTV